MSASTSLAVAPPLGTERLLYAASSYTCVLGAGMLAAGLAMRREVTQRKRRAARAA